MSQGHDLASFNRGVRACITWLHREAEQMNDPHARTVLNCAAFSLGQDKPNGEAASPAERIALPRDTDKSPQETKLAEVVRERDAWRETSNGHREDAERFNAERIASEAREKVLREAVAEIWGMSFGVSGKTGSQINEWFNERARQALSDLGGTGGNTASVASRGGTTPVPASKSDNHSHSEGEIS